MRAILKFIRYLVFGKAHLALLETLQTIQTCFAGLFITCNAIIASIGVWNYSLARELGWDGMCSDCIF
jgi:hypothetical protein